MRAKLLNLRAASLLRRGHLIAHPTGTLPGIAGLPHSPASMRAMQGFKQRHGPFLLLADSVGTALALARFIDPTLRQTARSSWPGSVTLVFPARPGLNQDCYQHSELAVRVDSDPGVRQLAKASGGLLLSSSLNRKGEAVAMPGLAHRMRHRRYILGYISGPTGHGKASTVMRIWRNHSTIIRQ
ncbi:MAG: Sua5/YciO/YrdC/YwlC family protein [Mariprofundaceae bacterium]